MQVMKIYLLKKNCFIEFKSNYIHVIVFILFHDIHSFRHLENFCDRQDTELWRIERKLEQDPCILRVSFG